VTTRDEKGILVQLTDTIARLGVNITQAICKSQGDGQATHTFAFTVSDVEQLKKVQGALERTKGVYRVERLRD
jgi:(p)ppGpp synthase/HD superfamily hydrolase